MLNFVICNDSSKFMSNLEGSLNKLFIKHDYDASIVFRSTNIADMINYVSNNKVDVIFMDIVFKSVLNGIEAAKKIRDMNKNLYIIFTTSYYEYVYLSFHVKTFDYILKPFSIERLESTLSRLFFDVSSCSNNFISVNNKTFINEEDIFYIKRDGMKLIFQTEVKSYETYSSFNKLSADLPPNFVRCHKSYIVNINNISSVELSSNTILFNSGLECYIGPKYKASFLAAFDNKK